MATRHSAFLRKAFTRYIARLDAGGIEPKVPYLPYDFDDAIAERNLNMVADTMLRDEIREMTNLLNSWHGHLLRWHAWNRVLSKDSRNDSWELRREFLEALIHHCLLSPASTRDALTFVATNAFHQLRLAIEPGYKDRLPGDPDKPGKKPHLTRATKEDRLAQLVSHWTEGAQIVTAIQNIDSRDYRNSTSDYRNRISHAIGPRLALGHTQAVTRVVQQATEMKKQPNGTHKLVPVTGRMAVSYGIGETPPLDVEAARQLNLAQYYFARQAYSGYKELLLVLLSQLPKST